MRSRLIPVRWFVSLAVIGLAAGVVYVISHRPPLEEAEAGSPNATEVAQGKRQIVCLGYVDLAAGVTSLTTAQPARVTEVLVQENARVEAGTLLLSTDDRASLAAVADAQAALRAATDQMENARRMIKRHGFQLQKQDAVISASRARLAAAKRGLELKQSLQSVHGAKVLAARAQLQAAKDELELKQSLRPVHDAKILAARARLQAAKRTLELKQNLQAVQQANEKEVAIAKEQVSECEAGVQAEIASLTDQKEVAVAEAQVKEYEANLEVELASSAGKKEVEVAEEDVKQWEASLDVEIVRRAELELADQELPVRQAQANVERAQATLAQAQALAAGQQVRAPVAGTVLRILTRQGEIVSGTSPAILFAPDGPRIVRSEVEQLEVDRVKVGSPVVIKDDVVHGGVWHGEVLQLANWYSKRRTIMEDVSTLTDVPTVELLVSIQPNGPPPRIGQRVRVHIEAAEPAH